MATIARASCRRGGRCLLPGTLTRTPQRLSLCEAAGALRDLTDSGAGQSGPSWGATPPIPPAVAAGNVERGPLGRARALALGHFLASTISTCPASLALARTEGPALLSRPLSTQAEDAPQLALKKVLHRCKQRGVLELDLLLGRWAEEHISSLTEKHLTDLSLLLDQESPDLLQWLLGQAQPPAPVSSNEVFQAIRQEVKGRLDEYSHPETKANPGAAWVKGWGDIGRSPSLGMPPGGNQ